jgi:hypothetical protein
MTYTAGLVAASDVVVDPDLNEPLTMPTEAIPMTEQLRDAQDAAVASAGDRQIVPEEGGVAGRAARAHDEAAAALEIGDVDRAIGAEQLAQALTDLAVDG